MSIRINDLGRSVNTDYTNAALTLGMRKKEISLIEFNSLMPRFTENIFDLHLYVWTMLIIFEFIKGGLGLGFMLRQAFEYKDLAAFFAAAFVIGITVYSGSLILKHLRNKYFSWE
jgi:ABC-type nitrate/sulfonate/bicarbonate transport system permease component